MLKGPSYTIHPFSVASYPALRAVGGLEPLPAIAGRRRDTPWPSGHRETYKHSHSQIISPYHQTCMSLSCRRKPTYAVKTYAEAGRTCTRRPRLKSNLEPSFCEIVPPFTLTFLYHVNLPLNTVISSIETCLHDDSVLPDSDCDQHQNLISHHTSLQTQWNLLTNNPNWYKHNLLGKVITKPPKCITLRVSSGHLYSSSKPCRCLLSCFLCVWKSGCGWFAG